MHSRAAARTANLQLTALTAFLVVFGLLSNVSHAFAQQAEPSRFADTASAAPQQQQQHAIEHSDAFYTRLTIHRYGSYIELPLFGAEYYLGQKLYNGTNVGTWVKPTHAVVAAGLGALFAVNTVTGVWNLVEARKDPGVARRLLHSALMLGSDAGFAYVGLVTAHGAGRVGTYYNRRGELRQGTANQHRNAAIASISAATVGTLIMWLWKD